MSLEKPIQGRVYLSNEEKHPICIELTELDHCVDAAGARRLASLLDDLASGLRESAVKIESGETDPELLTGN